MLRLPLVAYLLALDPIRAVVGTRWPRCVSAACLRIPPSAFGRRAGLQATPPLFLRKSGPGVRTYLRTWLRGSGSLAARACGASDPCGKAIQGGRRKRPGRWGRDREQFHQRSSSCSSSKFSLLMRGAKIRCNSLICLASH